MTSEQIGAALIKKAWGDKVADDLANSVRFTAVDLLADRLWLLRELEARLADGGADNFERGRHQAWLEDVFDELERGLEA
jgi:hypothetical protein